MNKLCSILLTSGVLDHTFAWHHSYLAPSLTFFRDDKIEFRLLTHVSTACVYLASLQLPDKSIYQIERETEAEKRRVWKHMITYCPIADLDVFFFFFSFSTFNYEMANLFIHFFAQDGAGYVIKTKKREESRAIEQFSLADMYFQAPLSSFARTQRWPVSGRRGESSEAAEFMLWHSIRRMTCGMAGVSLFLLTMICCHFIQFIRTATIGHAFYRFANFAYENLTESFGKETLNNTHVHNAWSKYIIINK